MTDTLLRLRKDYGSAFLGYLTRRDEKGLRAAYEIGRRSMGNGISILDLVQIHHDVLLNALSSANSEAELQDSARAAAAFLVEALASFEMAQRGFLEIGPGRDQPRS